MIVHPLPPHATRFGFALRDLGGGLATPLGRHLDDGFHLLRNVRAGSLGSIETVVVGPGGSWTLARGHEHGRFRKRNGHWYRWNGSTESWVPWTAEPIDAARLAGHRLELHLERAGLPATVEACLVTGRGMTVEWDADQRPGIHVQSDLDRLASRIARDTVLTAAQVERIVALLDPRQPLPRLAHSTPG